MSKTTVILPGPGQFRRTVRKDGQPVLDDDGNPRVLLFNSRQGVELTAEELEAVRDDIGNVLHIAKVVDDKAKVFKPDSEATAKFVEQTRKRKAEEVKQRAKKESQPAAHAEPAGHRGGLESKDKR